MESSLSAGGLCNSVLCETAGKTPGVITTHGRLGGGRGRVAWGDPFPIHSAAYMSVSYIIIVVHCILE